MNKVIFAVLFIVLLAFGGCSGVDSIELTPTPTETALPTTTIEPTEQEPPEPTNAAIVEPNLGSSDETDTLGTITDDVFYNGIAASLLLTEPFADILGKPINEQGHFFFYDGLEIVASWDKASGSFIMAEFFSITKPSLLEIDGIALDMNRTELITTLGNPIEYYGDSGWEHHNSHNNVAIKYHVSGSTIDYVLEFWFTHPDNEEDISIISIRRTGL